MKVETFWSAWAPLCEWRRRHHKTLRLQAIADRTNEIRNVELCRYVFGSWKEQIIAPQNVASAWLGFSIEPSVYNRPLAPAIASAFYMIFPFSNRDDADESDEDDIILLSFSNNPNLFVRQYL